MQNQTQVTIGKTGLVLTTGDMPQESRDFIFTYGLKQILNDCHSSIKRADYETEEEFVKAVNDTVTTKLANLEQGKFTVRNSSTREPVDPIEKLVHRMAKEIVTNAIKAKGVKVKDVPAEKFAEILSGYIEKNKDVLVKEAKAQLKKAEGLDVSLDDLGL